MNRNFPAIVCGALVLLCVSGCASLGTYFENRGLDFVDCFKADVGIGGGIEVHILCTDAISTGAGMAFCWKAGFKGRNFGIWSDMYCGIPFILSGWILEQDIIYPYTSNIVAGVDNFIFYKRAIEGAYETKSVIFINCFKDNSPNHGLSSGNSSADTLPFNDMIKAFDFEAGFTCVFVGANVGFSGGQFADFLLGWFGADIAGDNK
jgi:hypothetical protein